MTEQEKRELRGKFATLWGCAPEEIEGQRFGDLLNEADRTPGAVIYWGSYTDDQLSTIL